MGTYLAFEGTITGCKPVIAKLDQYGGGKKGSLEVTLVVDQPQQEKKPQLPYWMAADGKPITREQYEAALATDTTLTTKSRNESLDRFDKVLAGYTKDLAAWEQRQAGFYEATRNYASLIGIAAVFGNQKLAVTLTPSQQDMLPGFALDLLAAPAEQGAAT